MTFNSESKNCHKKGDSSFGKSWFSITCLSYQLNDGGCSKPEIWLFGLIFWKLATPTISTLQETLLCWVALLKTFLASCCTSRKTIGFYMPLILSDIFFWQQVACNYLFSLLSRLIAPANLLTRGRHNVQKHLCLKILTICPPEGSC